MTVRLVRDGGKTSLGRWIKLFTEKGRILQPRDDKGIFLFYILPSFSKSNNNQGLNICRYISVLKYKQIATFVLGEDE